MYGIDKNNKGYSIVEVIIVVAIVAAVGLTTLLSAGMVSGANAKTCANDIMGVISECKIMTMSKGQGNVRLLLYRSDNGNICGELQTRESSSGTWVTGNGGAEKVGAKKCTVTDGKGNEIPDLSDAWEIYFDRSSGSFLYSDDSGKPNTSVTQINVLGGSRHYRIKFEKLTGKSILEQL